MNSFLHNMSCPSRSNVKFKQVQLNKYIAFSPLTLEDYFQKVLNTTKFDLAKEVEKFYDKNKNKIENIIEKPTGFMIAEIIEINKKDSYYKEEIRRKLSIYSYKECNSILLLIVVLCSTVGDLYIPNRQLSFENNKFDKILLFPEKEVKS